MERFVAVTTEIKLPQPFKKALNGGASSRLRSPAHLLLPRRRPELALRRQVFALLQLSLPQVAAQQGVAVLIHPVGEVLAGDADATATNTADSH